MKLCWLLLAPAVVVSAVGFAGCGDDDGTEGDGGSEAGAEVGAEGADEVPPNEGGESGEGQAEGGVAGAAAGVEGEEGDGLGDHGIGGNEGPGEGEGEGEGEALPDQDLCGEVSGELPAEGTYTLVCAITVPAGETLTIGAGSSLAMGTNSVAVDGTLIARDLTVTASLQAGFGLRSGSVVQITGGRVEVVEIEAGAPLFDVEDATLTLTDVTLVEGEERREAIRVRPKGQLTLSGVQIEGFWIGVAFEAMSSGTISDGEFIDCLTGVHVVGAARPTVSDTRFEGLGFHLRVDPAVFSVGGDALLSGNEFVGGVPITLSGQVVNEVALVEVDGVGRFEVLELRVAQGGTLNIADDIEISLLGVSIEVAGTVAIGAARFAGLLAPALRFTAGGGGTVAGATFSSGGAGGIAMVEVVDGAPELSDVTFEDAAGNAVCIRTSGPDAAPIIRGSHLGCWQGVSVEEGAAHVEGTTFEGHDTGVRLESAGAQLRSLTFVGDGDHLSLGPDWFGEGVPAALGLSTHDFGDEGEPFVVGGVLRSDAHLVALIEEEPLPLTALSVRPAATLTAAPGLELRQGGTSITVDGRAEFDQVLFSRLEGPAVRWRESATGFMRRSRLEFSAGGAFSGISISDSSPTIEDNEIDGGVSGGVGVEVLGHADVDEVAAPAISRNQMSNLRIGIHIVGDAEPAMADNTFDEVRDEVVTTDLGDE